MGKYLIFFSENMPNFHIFRIKCYTLKPSFVCTTDKYNGIRFNVLHVDLLTTGFFFFFFRITLGNQLDGIHLLDPDVVARFKQQYPDGVISKPKAPMNCSYYMNEQNNLDQKCMGI